MTHQVQIHGAQTSILRELLFKPKMGYAELQKPTGLTSDHFSFHIKRLVEVGMVEKVASGKYALTLKGKEYANTLDTDQNTIERQPKATVILAITRDRNKEKEYLFQKRLKHPYYGYWGFPTGKIRWGETVLETAARELKEETGLEAKHAFKGVYHEHVYQEETGELLEDKLFFVVHCHSVSGELIEEFEGGKNVWIPLKEMETKKVFASYQLELEVSQGKHRFVEQIHKYSKEEF